MDSFYKTTLQEAWHTFLVNKRLWFLGLFLMLIGTEGEYALVIKNIEKIQNFSAMTSISDLPLFIQKSFWDERVVSEAFKLFVGDGALFTALGFLAVLLLASFLISAKIRLNQVNLYSESRRIPFTNIGFINLLPSWICLIF